MWQWSPGAQTAPLSPTQCATPSCGWALVAINGGSPPARYGHASGILADKLFIFGGLDASGAVLSDMWAFSRTDKSWAPVALTGAALPAQTGAPAGAFLGSIFYLSLTTASGAALYRVKPCFDCAPASGSSGSAGPSAALVGGLAGTGGALAAAAIGFIVVRRPQWVGLARRTPAGGSYFTSLDTA